jgi:hypothetical protein
LLVGEEFISIHVLLKRRFLRTPFRLNYKSVQTKNI